MATVIGGATIAIAAAAALVTAVKSEWDPNLDLLTAWLPRAEILYYLHAIDPSKWSSFLDPWYPPLVPALYATTFEFAGGFHPSLLSLQQALLGVAFVLAALAILDRVAPALDHVPVLRRPDHGALVLVASHLASPRPGARLHAGCRRPRHPPLAPRPPGRLALPRDGVPLRSDSHQARGRGVRVDSGDRDRGHRRRRPPQEGARRARAAGRPADEPAVACVARRAPRRLVEQRPEPVAAHEPGLPLRPHSPPDLRDQSTCSRRPGRATTGRRRSSASPWR